MTMDLNELADRVEALDGPDRETDAIIWLAVTPGATRKTTVIPENEQRKGWTIDETREASGKLIIVPAYTASIDAAMTLADPSWWVNISGPLSEAAYGYSREDLRVMRAGFEMIGPPYSSTARTAIVGDPVSRIARVLTAAALRCKALGAVHTLEGGL